ncbi:MAG TPA: putative metal-binding motif-containing protein [Myxococcaceae bacterium]|nr:putative metal-binding motif-containing protein [Myxococcaceae bacterium]
MSPTQRSDRLWPAALILLAAGCTQSAGADFTLHLDPAAKVTCVLAFAELEDGSELTSGFQLRGGRDALEIGLFETRGLSRAFVAGAEGYWSSGGGCQPPMYLDDEAPRQDSAFVSGKVVPLTLDLAMPAGADKDGDGFRSTGFGGGDCDDRRADVNPEAQEVCGDGADNDCSGAVDCADPSCAGAGACEAKEATCGDGLDNDGDRLIDCADPDCDGRACSDGNPCTVNDKCSGGICTVAPVICASPPTACHEPAGTCAGDGGCVYGVDAGSSCAGGFCGYDGSCGAIFRYAPANFTPPPIAMFGPAQRFNCNTSTFDSSPSATNPFQNWCGQPTPPVVVVTQGASGIDAVVLPMRGLRVETNHTLRLIGTRPVILAVFGDVVVDGLVNAGGGGTTPGAGGNDSSSSACGATGAGAAGMASSSSGGGGGGGAFAGTGGAGGNSNLSAAGALGGSVNGGTDLQPIRGGCGGGAGGDSGGTGGGGGGGVQISASDTMTIRGKVASQGGGGQGGQSDQSGGGGGGSGGAVLLEATSMSFSAAARVTVNGGGGGEGDNCCASGTYDGAGGANGKNDGVGVAAGGDTSNSPGGAGGGGGAGPTAAADGADGGSATAGGATIRGGGGGGGGGVGRIRLDFTAGCAKDPGAIFSGAITSSQASDGGCP